VKPFLWHKAVRDSELDPTAKHVGHVLGTYMNTAGDTFVGKKTLANGASLKSVRAVDGAIARLEAAGYLEIQRSKGRRPNHYVAVTPHADAGFGEANPASDDSQPRISRQPTPHGGAPEVDLSREEVGKALDLGTDEERRARAAELRKNYRHLLRTPQLLKDLQ
jgi:DNA-binding MarR family transcriptional regulator